MVEAKPDVRFFTSEKGVVHCKLCPHACAIAEGKSGICRVRTNKEGTLALPYYGVLSSAAIDPIEKKPLYHYHPGSLIFSVGFFGCNFRCPFCQNYSISQRTEESAPHISPEALVREALKEGSFGIAYTYSEPLVHFEYVLETARIAREKGLKNILVSNGYLNPEPAEELLSLLDAANIDLKAFNNDFYQKVVGGRLNPVKEFIRRAAAKIHLEVTTLVIPGKNDDPAEIEEAARFLSGLNKKIPYHLTCYYPRYKYTVRATSEQDLEPLIQRARNHLSFVYVGNTGGENTTFCPNCKQTVILRQGYSTRIVGGENGNCSRCGEPIYCA